MAKRPIGGHWQDSTRDSVLSVDRLIKVRDTQDDRYTTNYVFDWNDEIVSKTSLNLRRQVKIAQRFALSPH